MPATRFITALLVLCTLDVHAQLAQFDALDHRAKDVCAIVSAKPLKFDTVFTSVFLKQVSPLQLAMGIGQLTKQTGSCSGISITQRLSSTSARGEVSTANGFTIPFDLTVESAAPYLIAGLFLRSPVRTNGDMSTAIDDLTKLDGVKSLCVMDLSQNEVIVAMDTSLSLPIGSTFKLYVLGELMRSIDAGEHSWEEVVRLSQLRRSLPSGVMHEWPLQSPVTLHTLASNMISISDNTATDHLVLHLGRSKIEEHQKVMGHQHLEVNAPFLTTFNMFVLKNTDSAKPAQRYLRMSADDRRKMLTSIDSWSEQRGRRPSSTEDFAFDSKPVLVDSIEWFASTADLCRAMKWIRDASEKTHGEQMLGILSINPGLDIDSKAFPFIGYKGGSETGVLNMTFLLQRNDDHWFAVSASWMNTASEVDLVKFSSAITEIISTLR